MPENVMNSMTKMEEALKRLPKTDAEIVAADAAARAETIADYVERLSRADSKSC